MTYKAQIYWTLLTERCGIARDNFPDYMTDEECFAQLAKRLNIPSIKQIVPITKEQLQDLKVGDFYTYCAGWKDPAPSGWRRPMMITEICDRRGNIDGRQQVRFWAENYGGYNGIKSLGEITEGSLDILILPTPPTCMGILLSEKLAFLDTSMVAWHDSDNGLTVGFVGAGAAGDTIKVQGNAVETILNLKIPKTNEQIIEILQKEAAKVAA